LNAHIFLPTDGSASASLAEAYVRAFPWPAPVHVTLMTVIDLHLAPFTSVLPAARRLYAGAVTALRQDAKAKAWGVLDKTRHAVAPHVDSVGSRVQEGRPGPAIVDAATACGADLVVVGCPKLRPWRRLTAGRVAIHVARSARCSVLVAKRLPAAPGRFLLALDGSADSEAAVRWLADLRLSSEAWVHIVAGEKQDEIVTEASKRLAASGARVTATIRSREAGSEILAVARVVQPDVIVVGSRSEGATRRPIVARDIDSVARRIVVGAGCSVVVVRC
jgi:nucleotide-binding universal stress UspA family protein